MLPNEHELQLKILDTRTNLQTQLRMSAELIEQRVRKMMINMPELQLKNQSIIVNDEGAPIFLWDSIYFDMTQESCDPYFDSLFESQKVKIKRTPLSIDDYRLVLDNFSYYSLHTASSSTLPGRVVVTPILYAFMSKNL